MMRDYRGLLGPLAIVVLFLIARRWSPFEPHQPPVGIGETAASGASQGGRLRRDDLLAPGDLVRERWSEEDWWEYSIRLNGAARDRVDMLSFGEAMSVVGRSFVGTPYQPGTLEVPGPERLVINFRALDCVTFVENALAMTAYARVGGTAAIAERDEAEYAHERLLGGYRYRDGSPIGYASRLHYFTDWIARNVERGYLVDVTRELGGVLDTEPIDFMTTHVEAYPQLADPANVAAIRDVEQRLSAAGRYYVPEERIAAVAHLIRDGDVIAATSTVEGLDVAHVGLALWVDGSLHLLHAPLVGDSVEISELPLAERILSIPGQDGIIVARPVGS